MGTRCKDCRAGDSSGSSIRCDTHGLGFDGEPIQANQISSAFNARTITLTCQVVQKVVD